MPEIVRYEKRAEVAVITVDNPPVNALSPGVPEGIDAAVARAAADPDVKAAVLIGAGGSFIAGADIRFLGAIKSRDESVALSRLVHARLLRLEDCPKPLVAAISGNALGGGLEYAMACHYRVAVSTAKVGQPEVALGIIPGAAGTERLPRLAGAATALGLCTQGSPISAGRALKEGILDQIVEGDLLEGAVAFARGKAAAGAPPKTSERTEKIADRAAGLDACQAARAGLKKTARGAHAPYAAVDAVEAAITMSFAEGSEREIQLFADCVVSDESHSMVRLFFAEHEVSKIPDVPKNTPVSEIKSAAIIGAGTMGGGIAMAYVDVGIPVILKEADQKALERGLAVIQIITRSRFPRAR